MKNLKNLRTALKLLGDIELDIVSCNDYTVAPATVFGHWNPELAGQMYPWIQGWIFRCMAENGMPLNGWNEFDQFVTLMELTGSVESAYIPIAAQEERMRIAKNLRLTDELAAWPIEL